MIGDVEITRALQLAPRQIRVVAGVSRVLTRMAIYLSEGALISVRNRNPSERLKKLVKNVQDVCQHGLDILGFEVEVVGRDEELLKKKNFLFVGNHMSYMDILVTSSVQPSVFVTSVDMGKVPLLGQLAAIGGSIFVERRNRDHVERDLGNITAALKNGFNVLIYPEGTSSNGLGILPFKKSLLMAAVEAGVDIMPIVLKYTHIDGQPFGPENADKVAWHGDMSFAPHLVELVKLKQVKCRLEFLPPIKVTPESTRNDLADKTYKAITDVYFTNHVPRPEQPVGPA